MQGPYASDQTLLRIPNISCGWRITIWLPACCAVPVWRAFVSVTIVHYISYEELFFWDQNPFHKLKMALISETKIPIFLKGLYFNDQSSRISVLKTRPRRLGEMVVQQCRIAIFYIKIPKFEIKNCKDCFSRFLVGNWASPRTFSFQKKRIYVGVQDLNISHPPPPTKIIKPVARPWNEYASNANGICCEEI